VVWQNDGITITEWRYENILKTPIRLWRFREENHGVFVNKKMLGKEIFVGKEKLGKKSEVVLTISGEGCGESFTHKLISEK
jgi:hypothetical protein